MWHRVAIVFRTGLEAHWGRGLWPVAPLITHGSITALLCGMVSSELAPFSYALFALSLCAGLLALPLLGDFGALLRSDPAAEWIEALPVSALELRIARTLSILLLIGVLSAAALLPAVVFAPAGTPVVGLFVAGLGQALFVTAAILTAQSVLGRRAETALVAFQTVLVAGVVVGALIGLRSVSALARIAEPGTLGGWVSFYPPAWFATPFASVPDGFASLAPALGATLAAAAALAFIPLPPATRARRTGGALSFVLEPARSLAARIWVRRGERATFHLVFEALPLEREFVLRTYPMLGIPLALLGVGVGDSSGNDREALIALLMFTPAIYLPILLVHVPATASAGARWLLDSAPLPREALDEGAIKAVAVRFLLPLYALLAIVAASFAGPSFVVRLALPAFLVSVALTRILYAVCVKEPPLSTAPDEVEFKLDWAGILMTLAIAMTILSLVAYKFVTTVTAGLVVSACLLIAELALARRAHALRGSAH
ncbi:MAG: hypothetical protein ACKVWV_06540 [Planctomycetota bacterium]